MHFRKWLKSKFVYSNILFCPTSVIIYQWILTFVERRCFDIFKRKWLINYQNSRWFIFVNWLVSALLGWINEYFKDLSCVTHSCKHRFLQFYEWYLFSNMLFTSLSHSFVPRVSATEAGNSGPLGPSYGPDTPQRHRHHCCPTQRDGVPSSSDKTLCHYPTHHTVSVWLKGSWRRKGSVLC